MLMANDDGNNMKRTFKVSAVWDAEAGVYYSESDIEGLHIEAATLEEFEAILMEVGADLVLANHVHRPVIPTTGPSSPDAA